MVRNLAKVRIPEYFRIFFALASFLVALDASIALNRWWVEGGFEAYLQNLILMLVGFVAFVVLFSRSKVEMIGYVFLCVAVYFIGDFEIGGLSRLYLTPFDPLLGIGPYFPHGSASIAYRKGMAIGTSLLAASILAASKIRLKPNGQK